MMDRRLVVLLSLVLATATAATPSRASARSKPSPPGGTASTADKPARVRNRADFDFVVETVTENDAGYPTRVTGANRDSLARLTSRFQETNTWLADRMEARLGEFVNPYARAFSIKRYDTVLPYPRRVAVLVDGAGSSGEQFLLEARQSHKVTLFGKSSSFGSLDVSNLVWVSTPSDRFWLAYATSRSMRLPEDPVGYAQAWLERQVD